MSERRQDPAADAFENVGFGACDVEEAVALRKLDVAQGGERKTDEHAQPLTFRLEERVDGEVARDLVRERRRPETDRQQGDQQGKCTRPGHVAQCILRALSGIRFSVFGPVLGGRSWVVGTRFVGRVFRPGRGDGMRRALTLGAMLTIGIGALVAQAQQVPTFQVDPLWPKPLPNHWLFGSITGVAVDAQNHVWVVHRGAASMTARTEIGAATNPPTSEKCCVPAPAGDAVRSVR